MTISIQNAESGNDGSGWSCYTLGKSNDREGATLIVGDTHLGDSICERKDYKSGNYVRFVISFNDDDNVTLEEAREIVKAWFKEYMTGFDASEYHLDIVEHTDTKQLHYHGRIPKVNLLTDTQLKPYWHQSDLDYKIAVNEFIAEKYDLTLGTDYKRLVLPQQEQEKRIEKWRKEHNQEPYDLTSKTGRAVAEEGITDLINDLNTQGLVSNLDEVKAEVEALNLTIVNEGFDRGKKFHYITIQQGESKLRLKGDIYGKRFYEHNREDRAKAISDNRSLDEGSGSHKRSRTEVNQSLQKERAKRLKWIDRQYCTARKRAVQRLEKEQRKLAEKFHQEQKSTPKSPYPHRPIDRRNHRNIGNSLLHPKLHQSGEAPQPDSDAGRKQMVKTEPHNTTAEATERPKHDKGIDNDTARTEIARRIRKTRIRARVRAKAVRNEFEKNSREFNFEVPIFDERTLQAHVSRSNKIDRAIIYFNGAAESDYKAIEATTLTTANERAIGQDFDTIVHRIRAGIGELTRSLKHKFDRRTQNLTIGVGNVIKKIKLFERGKKKAMSQLRSKKINLLPRR